MEPITWDSSREEVLAAVEDSERRARETRQAMESAVFPEVPDGFVGCVASLDGRILAHYGSVHDDDPSLAAQERAGEEDQSQPGWDGL